MAMFNIICFGEMLWDVLPDKELPGGAPVNAAYHLQKLGQQVAVISRVGNDDYGRRLLTLLRDNHLTTEYVQQDTAHPTGSVLAQPISDHDVEYTFVYPVAWDFIEWQPAHEELLQQAGYLVFGSLAARDEVSAATLDKLLQSPLKKVLDINLRPPHFTQEQLLKLMKRCDILKLNAAELELISSWSGELQTKQEKVQAIAREYNIPIIIVTMGGEGAMLYMHGQLYTHPGFKIQVADTIGSGDAFLAGFLSSLIQGRSPEHCLAYANATGALVASRSGGQPAYDIAEVESLLD